MPLRPHSSAAWKTLAAVVTLMGLAASAPAFAQGTELPAKVQAVMFKKILLYDRTIEGNTRLAIMYGDEGGKADELKRAFEAVGLNTTTVKATDMEALANFNVVYLLPKAANADVRSATFKHKVLSLSGRQLDANEGFSSVAVELAGSKPTIYVNHALSKKQGHDLSSDLLRLATIIN
jgi:hypothetical protein